MRFANIFSPFMGCLFTLLWYLLSPKVFNFEDVQFVFLLLLPVPWCRLRNHCQIQCHEAFPRCFLLKVLQFELLRLGLWSILNHFFLCDVRGGSSLILLHVDMQFSQYFCRKTVLSHWPLLKNYLMTSCDVMYVHGSLFLNTLFYFIVLYVVYMPVPHYFAVTFLF